MKKYSYKLWLSKIVLFTNTPASLQTTLSAEARLAEGQFLLEEDSIYSLIYCAGTRRLQYPEEW
jgi:hypothetical protein